MEKLLSKNVFGSIIVFSWVYIFSNRIFSDNFPGLCVPIGLQELTNLCEATALYFLIFIPISVFFAVLAFRDIQVYRKWGKFTWIFLGIYFVVYLFSPTDAPDLVLFYKETVAIGAIIFYSVASLMYVAYLKFRKA